MYRSLFACAAMAAGCATTGGEAPSFSTADLSSSDIDSASGLGYCDALGFQIENADEFRSGDTVVMIPQEETARESRRERRRTSTGSRIPQREDSVRSYPTQVGGAFVGSSTTSGAIYQGSNLSGRRYDMVRNSQEARARLEEGGGGVRCVIR